MAVLWERFPKVQEQMRGWLLVLGAIPFVVPDDMAALLVQRLAIGLDDGLVPVVGVLLHALEGAVAVVEAIHVHKAIALAHLAGAGADHVDGAPAARAS